MTAGENSRAIPAARHSHEMYQPILVTTVTVLTLIAISPAFLVDIPAMVDYPNHLARMHLLVRAQSGNPHPFFAVEWRLYPNLAMDLIVPQVARVMTVESATKLFLLAAQMLIVSGAIALEYAVKRRHEIAGLVALAALYNLTFAWGLLNFQFGVGLALWGIAIWIIAAETPWLRRLAVHALLSAALFLTHLFALGIYGLAIGLYELWRIFDRREVWQASRTVVVLALPPTLLFAVMSMTGGGVGGSETEWLPLIKVQWPARLMNAYSLPLSIALGVALVTLWFALRITAGATLSPAGRWIGTGLLLAFLLMPVRLFSVNFVDQRILVGAMLILPAFVTFSQPRRAALVAAIGFGAIILANLASVAAVWLPYRYEYARLISSFDLLQPRSRVLVALSDAVPRMSDGPMLYGPTLAAHYADALVPSLYAVHGAQPLAIRPEFERYAVRDTNHYLPVPFSVLSGNPPPFAIDWPQRFSYLYLVGPHAPNPMPDRLTEIARGERFMLFRIR